VKYLADRVYILKEGNSQRKSGKIGDRDTQGMKNIFDSFLALEGAHLDKANILIPEANRRLHSSQEEGSGRKLIIGLVFSF